MREKIKHWVVALGFSLAVTTCVLVVGVGGLVWLYGSVAQQKAERRAKLIHVEKTTAFLGCNVPIMIDGTQGVIDRAQVEKTIQQYEKECY